MVTAECQPGHETDDLEWEEWDPTKTTFIQHMIAGSIAGLAEHACMFPIDTLKTHIQCERCGSSNPANVLRYFNSTALLSRPHSRVPTDVPTE